MQRKRESGQAVVLVVVATGLVLAGALGFAVDSAQLYGHRQMAQAAADAAAQAGILSIYNGTNTGTNAFGSATFTCTLGTDTRTPCAYARLNGFDNSGSADTVTVDFPTSVAGVNLSPDFSPAAVHAMVTRSVKTTFMQILGASATKTIKAAGTAAIVQVTSPIPIVVLHLNLSGAFSLQGGGSSNTNVKICGGPQQSIQVNSNSSTAVSVGGSQTVDLSKGGPLDTAGNCTTGTGTDFGVFGGPASSSLPSWMTPTGTTEHYYSPHSKIPDPFNSVAAPSKPAAATPITSGTGTTAGTGDCPAWASKGCTIYPAGWYSTGLCAKNTVGIMKPGVFYVDGTGAAACSPGQGFGTGANGDMIMCSTTCGTAPTGFTGNGMLVYLTSTGGTFRVTSNSSTSLLGSDVSSSYKGILFFVAHDSPAATGSGSHLLGGGGNLTLSGTIYLANKPTPAGSTYQNLRLRGNTGSSTFIKGEIVVDTLDVGGGGTIQMQLSPNASFVVDQVALVN